MILRLVVILVGGMLGTTSQAQWKMVWNDEFTQPDGTQPDAAKWDFDLGTGSSGWGNNELECYTDRTNNVRIEGGQLIIEAQKEHFGKSEYTSGRLLTRVKSSWTYGRFEARIKIPSGHGIWPAFWMMGTNLNQVNWPNCGEIDIMENIGKEPNIIHGTIHGPGYSGDKGIGGPYQLPSGAAFADDFHIYAMEWTTNTISWFVDSKQYFKINAANIPKGSEWVYTKPEFILINLAIGGNWPGYPDNTTVFPQRMVVDYVRVYSHDADATIPVAPSALKVTESDPNSQ